MSRREAKIYNSKLRRNRQQRRNILLSFMTFFLVVSLSVTINGFLSNAKSGNRNNDYKYYKSIMVKSGDTLWSIANENIHSAYKNTDEYVLEVKQVNHLQDDTITAGNYIVIPYFSNQFVD